MNRSKRIIPAYDAVNALPAGLADLVQAYREQHVPVGKITLKRGLKIHKYTINEYSGVTPCIQAQFKSVVISVSFLPPIPSHAYEILQSRTKYAAIAAFDRGEVSAQLPLLEPGTSPSAKMIGSSPQVRELVTNIERIARSNHVVLILGESGTGKTTAATMIHEQSRRADKPFIDVNCAGVPGPLMESELFGYEKGAFTGAVARKRGLFEAAHEGTIFLDEIGELKRDLQAKLLTAIEQRQIRRLGGTSQFDCDVRIIAASSRDLQQMVAQGTFREDLYYRLAVLELLVPPLRQHPDDIPLLISNRLMHEQHSLGLNRLDLDDDAIGELMVYDWPGNVRQLHNVLARLSVDVEFGCRITRAHVRKQLDRFNQGSTNDSLSSNDGSILLPLDCRKLLPGESLQQFTVRVKRALIHTVRNQTGGLTAASARLKVDRTALSKLQTRLNSSTKQQVATTLN